MKIHLVVIDPQNDFTTPQGSLFVQGADQDMSRLALMVKRLGRKLDDIHITMDVEVETLSPEESKALWDAHTARLRLLRRAQDYATAVEEEREFYEGLKANLAAGQMATPEELKKLSELRGEIAKLQPHTLRWQVTTKDGTVVQVETRDEIDWCDDHTNATMVVGAFAEIPWGDPASKTTTIRECPSSNDGAWPRDREADHKMAVEKLAALNDWTVVDIARNGEKWNP